MRWLKMWSEIHKRKKQLLGKEAISSAKSSFGCPVAATHIGVDKEQISPHIVSAHTLHVAYVAFLPPVLTF